MKKTTWIILISVTILAAAAIWFFWLRKEPEVVMIDSQKVQLGHVANFITATGTLQPVDTVAVGAQISGIIKTVYVDFNSPVKKGQLLATLDKSLMNAQVQQFTAILQQAKANVVFQQSNFERQQKLFTVGAISKADQETANYQFKAAKDNVNSITAQLSTAIKNLSFTDIYSPIDGTVLSRNVSEGQTVASSFSTPTLFSIAKDLTKMQVQASVDEADIGNVKKGQRVQFSVDAFPVDTFNGTVQEIRLRSTVTANVVTYITIIDAPNTNMKLKPGMTANTIIYTQEVDSVLVMPTAALSFKPDSFLISTYHIAPDTASHRIRGIKKQKSMAESNQTKISRGWVWVLKDSNTIIGIPIRTGLDDKTKVEVVAGLKEGDEVITGYRKLTKKDAATAKTAKSPFLPSRGGGNRPRRAN